MAFEGLPLLSDMADNPAHVAYNSIDSHVKHVLGDFKQ